MDIPKAVFVRRERDLTPYIFPRRPLLPGTPVDVVARASPDDLSRISGSLNHHPEFVPRFVAALREQFALEEETPVTNAFVRAEVVARLPRNPHVPAKVIKQIVREVQPASHGKARRPKGTALTSQADWVKRMRDLRAHFRF